MVKPWKLPKHFRIEKPRHFRLEDFDPAETFGYDEETAGEAAAGFTKPLLDLQERLYATHTWAVLVVLQGIDASGKDGAIKHVIGAFNPAGCMVHAFKTPTSEDLEHDFLWRATKPLPRRGMIGIFNRSHYEEVLVVRVHEELLAKQQLPPQLVTERIWTERFEDINAFERHLARNGTLVVKFHLHISKEEQKRRLIDRIDNPAKQWKFSMTDIAERKLWKEHMAAYEDMIRHTSTEEAPWHVVPADNKWFARLVISATLFDELEKLGLDFPQISAEGRQELKRVRRALLAD